MYERVQYPESLHSWIPASTIMSHGVRGECLSPVSLGIQSGLTKFYTIYTVGLCHCLTISLCVSIYIVVMYMHVVYL